MTPRAQESALWILDGVRTPFAKAGGELASLPADELGRLVVRELIDRNGLDAAAIDEVIFGCVGQNARAANIARVIALRAGIPDSVPAATVHRNCASGMEAISQASMRAASDRGDLFLVGGTESMSGYPLEYNERATEIFGRLARARTVGARVGLLSKLKPSVVLKPRVALIDGLRDPICGLDMGQTAELLAREHGIDRETQDAYALESHQRATAARGRLSDEIMPVVTPAGLLRHDATVREDQSMAALGRLRPVFERRYGTVTAGNACPVTDGAVGLLVGTQDAAQALGQRPLGRLIDWEYVGLDPARMGLGPVHAIAALLDRQRLGMDDVDLFELNEAFSAQVLACLRAAQDAAFCRRTLGRDRPLGAIPRDRLNVNGGAIALGHPVGATGARLVLTLLHELRRRDLRLGIATLCVGGGQGAAMLVEANPG